MLRMRDIAWVVQPKGVAPLASGAYSDARHDKANHAIIAPAAVTAGDIAGWGEKER
jgi:hypothetical protein